MIWSFLSNGATQHMGIGSIGIDANETQNNDFEIRMETPEKTNIDEVVNFYFEIRKHLFPSQPSTQICINSNTGINDIHCEKSQTPPIPIPPPNYR